MRRTLLLIPHEIASIPVFGFGWTLGLMVLAALGITAYLISKRQDAVGFWKANALVWLMGAGVVTMLMPGIELESVTGEPVGMAIRGYGVMLLLGVALSVWLAVYRGRRYGIPEEIMLGIAPWLLIGGIAGARLFYVIEYRDRFFTGDAVSTIRNLLNFTEGGLVVYGSFIGGFLASLFYVVRHKLPFLRMGDAIVPSLFIGLCIGRIGCLMNGCCYGNACEPNWSALHFPNASPVYEDQLATGDLLGLKMDAARSRVESVVPMSLAARSGIEEGDRITKFGTVRSVEVADPAKPLEDAPLGVVAVIDGKEHYWSSSQLPLTANPVAPSQIISSIGALILSLGLCLFSRFTVRDGFVMLVGFASYAVLRFVMEMLRNDEPGQFGTELTIAQWVSIVVLMLSSGGLLWLSMRQFPEDRSHQAGPAGG